MDVPFSNAPKQWRVSKPEQVDKGSVTVVGVGVDSVQMIAAEGEAFMKADGDNYTVSVERGKPLSLKALPYGDTVWPRGKPIWKDADGKETAGTDTFTVDTSAEDASFTITVRCGISQKSIQIRTFNYQFKLYVRSTGNGEILDLDHPENRVGHVSWETRITNQFVTPAHVLPPELNAYFPYVDCPWGYHPSGNRIKDRIISPGELQPDQTARYVGGIIDRRSFIAVLAYTKNTHTAPGTYVLADLIKATFYTRILDVIRVKLGEYTICEGSEKNCTTVGLEAAREAGIRIAGTGYVDETDIIGDITVLEQVRIWLKSEEDIEVEGEFKGSSPWQLARE